MNTKKAIGFLENICESLSKQCDSGSGSDDVDTVMMGIEANKVINLLKRGEKFEEIFKELKIYCSVLERHDILKEIIRLELKYFPKGD